MKKQVIQVAKAADLEEYSTSLKESNFIITPSAAIPLQVGLVAADGVKAYWRRKDAGMDPSSPDAL